MDKFPRCHEPIILTDAEIACLEGVPDPGHIVDEVLACELQAGHVNVGPHLALGQAYGHHELWLEWLPPHQHRLVLLQEQGCCPAEGPRNEDPGPLQCELPAGHAGAHSFEMEASGGRKPTPEMERRIDELLDRDNPIE